MDVCCIWKADIYDSIFLFAHRLGDATPVPPFTLHVSGNLVSGACGHAGAWITLLGCFVIDTCSVVLYVYAVSCPLFSSLSLLPANLQFEDKFYQDLSPISLIVGSVDFVFSSGDFGTQAEIHIGDLVDQTYDGAPFVQLPPDHRPFLVNRGFDRRRRYRLAD